MSIHTDRARQWNALTVPGHSPTWLARRDERGVSAVSAGGKRRVRKPGPPACQERP